jgi:hypothetical protein
LLRQARKKQRTCRAKPFYPSVFASDALKLVVASNNFKRSSKLYPHKIKNIKDGTNVRV